MQTATEIIGRPAITQVTTEIKGHVIVYDLPCETRKAYEDAATDQKEDRQKKLEASKSVAATRQACTSRLYKLGLGCTHSVILAPTKTEKTQINEAIAFTKARYDLTNAALEKLGFRALPPPDIRPIPIVQTQFIEFRSIAEKNLMDDLERQKDEGLEKAQLVLNTPEAKKAKERQLIQQRLARLERNRQLAAGLGIQQDARFEIVIELWKAALAKVS